MTEKIESVKKEIEVNISIDKAFKIFTEGFNNWWPKEYTWSHEQLSSIKVGLKSGERCTEIGPDGFQIDWGKVLEYNPSKFFSFKRQINPLRVPEPDPEKASVVEVRFNSKGPHKTVIILEHKNIEMHGESAREYRDALA